MRTCFLLTRASVMVSRVRNWMPNPTLNLQNVGSVRNGSENSKDSCSFCSWCQEKFYHIICMTPSNCLPRRYLNAVFNQQMGKCAGSEGGSWYQSVDPNSLSTLWVSVMVHYCYKTRASDCLPEPLQKFLHNNSLLRKGFVSCWASSKISETLNYGISILQHMVLTKLHLQAWDVADKYHKMTLTAVWTLSKSFQETLLLCILC